MTTQQDQAGQRLIGSLRTADGKLVVRMEDQFGTTIDDLWSAITDPERLANWVARVSGDLRPGGAIEATFTSGWEGPGRIDVCKAPHRLLVTMSPGAPDQTVIEATLTAMGTSTLLVVEERGIPIDDAAGHGAGWQVHIEDLGTHLAGREVGNWRDR